MTTPASTETVEQSVEQSVERRRRAKAAYALLTRTSPVYDFPYRTVTVITGPDHAASFNTATDWAGALTDGRTRDSFFSHHWLLDASAAAAAGDPTGDVRRIARMDPDLVGVRSATPALGSTLLELAETGHAVVASSEQNVLDLDLAAKYGIRIRALDDLATKPARSLIGPIPGLAVTGPGQVTLTFHSGDAQFYDEPRDRFIAVTVADLALATDTAGVLDPSASTLTIKGRVINESNWEPGKRRAEVTGLSLAWLNMPAWAALIDAAPATSIAITEQAYIAVRAGGLA